MRKLTLLLAVWCLVDMTTQAQNWLLTGNAGTNTTTNFIGTTDNKALIFKTNNIERARIQTNGLWKFGFGNNNVVIDTTGVLKFNGIGGYQVADNKYVFQNSTNPNYGLFFNAVIPQYEFKDNLGNAVFSINANNGNGALPGTLKIGAFTLPNADGTNGQVLTTNGTGTVSWANVSAGTGANTALSNLTSTSVNQSLIPSLTNSKDLGSSSKAWKNLYIAGNAGIGVSNPVVKLEVKGGGDASLSGGGNILSGVSSASNIVIDDNEIMARNNGNTADLFLNHDGGNLLVGSNAYGTKVGINTTSPNAYLDIRGLGSSSLTSSLNIQNSPNNTLFLVRNDGRVGINTNSPSVALDVLGDAQFNTGNTTDCDMRLKTANSDMGWFASGGFSSMALYNYTTQTTLMRVLGDGRCGVIKWVGGVLLQRSMTHH